MKKGFAMLATSVALASGVLLTTGAPAFAIEDGNWECKDTGNGSLCVRYINNYTGVDIAYDKRNGEPITARFSYTSGGSTYYDDGYFTQKANKRKTFAWNNTNPSGCVTGYITAFGQSPIPSKTICR